MFWVCENLQLLSWFWVRFSAWRYVYSGSILTSIFIGNGISIVSNSTSPNRSLRINVGFLLRENAGYSRDIYFEPETFKIEDITIEQLSGKLRFTRTSRGILVQGMLTAVMSIDCTRCLRAMNLSYDIEFSELFAPASLANTISEEETPPNLIDDGDYIDLTPILREESILAHPIGVLCSKECKGLCPQCGQDLNEITCDCETDSIDPRLAALRSLLDDWAVSR